MINWFNIPDEGLSDGGLFEVKELEVTENGTYETKGEMYNKVTVNVEGGGGSSDFSIATVTTINNTSFEEINFNIPIVCEENELGEGSPAMIHNEMVIRSGEETHKVCMYKGLAFCEEAVPSLDYVITVSGDIVYEEGNMIITGDCTITIS